jgi:hypothetical protein
MMSKLEYHKKVYNLISASPNRIIDASFIEIDKTPQAVQLYEDLAINIEVIHNRLRLLTNSINTKIYDSINSFLIINELSESADILIINEKDAISFFDGITYLNFEQHENFLIKNHKVYLDFLSLLKKSETETEDSFHFVDSYNRDLRKISFVCLSDKGRLNIIYDLKAPLFDTRKSLSKSFEKFTACFDIENKSLLKFLKTSIISTASNFPVDKRLQFLIESLDEIVEKARINFEVYLNNLSIDKIKKDYDEVKSKYFDSLSDLLSNVSQKIIALPIGVSATLITVDKITGSIFYLVFIICVIITTSIYLSIILGINYKDLNYISKIFHNDYNTLLGNNFFHKRPEEKIVFEEIKTIIVDKISRLKIIIESYYWIMNIANAAISVFILSKLDIIPNALCFICIVWLFLLTILRNNILETSK